MHDNQIINYDNIHPQWHEVIKNELQKQYMRDLLPILHHEYTHHTIYPEMANIWHCFKYCAPSEIRVVILGQDPYHQPNQAHGLAFSVPDGVKHPPSLRNIFKELNNDLQIDRTSDSGDLTHWAKQGVLLLNNTLTVRANEANSHKNLPWAIFSDNIIDYLNKKHNNIVFILWGSFAHKKGKYINHDRHLVIKTTHPSPLSANRGGFFNTNPFSKANQYLEKNNQNVISW